MHGDGPLFTLHPLPLSAANQPVFRGPICINSSREAVTGSLTLSFCGVQMHQVLPATAGPIVPHFGNLRVLAAGIIAPGAKLGISATGFVTWVEGPVAGICLEAASGSGVLFDAWIWPATVPEEAA